MIKKSRTKTGQEGLREVKNAGYTATKKIVRDKSVNRRAGLHGKFNEEGVVRVKRRKPLGLKHVRRMRKVAAVAAVGVVGAIAVVGVGFFAPVKDSVLDDFGNPTVSYAVPTDGSKPTDYTLVENVGFLNYVLSNQPYWSSETHSKVQAMMGIEQGVDNYKKYYNGILISADCSFSALSESMQYGEQFCQAYDVVLTRYSTSNKTVDLNNGMDAPWSDGPVDGAWTVAAFRENRGLPPLDFSVYVLNEKTIANAYDYSVVENGDGTFSMSLTLNVNTNDKETAADYYYRQQMWYNGGLNELPVISKTTLTYTFDANWQVLELVVEDAYRAKAMGINSNCTSRSVTTFCYDEESAYNTYWEDYFKAEYERVKNSLSDDATTEKEEVPTAMGYLGSAFASVMTDGAVLKIGLNVDSLSLNGVVSVEMEEGGLSGLAAKIGDILVWLDGNTLYINDCNAKYKLNIDGLFSSDEEEGDLLGGFDLASLMDQMTSGEFVYDTETGAATLSSVVELFGLKINMVFEFQKTESGIELVILNAEIPVGGKVVKASLSFGDESDKPAIPTDTAAYTDILNDGITFDISLNANGFTLEGIAKIIMQNGGLSGVYADLGNITVFYDCPHNMLYLSVGSAKYKLDISKLGTSELDLGSFDVNTLLESLLSNLVTDKNSIGSSLNLNIDAIDSVLKAALNVQLLGGIKVDAGLTLEDLNASVTVALTNREVVLPSFTGYQDILNGEMTFDVSLTLITGSNRNEVTVEGKVALCLVNGSVSEIRADFGEFAVYFDFVSNQLYIKVGTTKFMLNLDEMDLSFIGALASFDGGEADFDIPDAVKQLLTNLIGDGKIISSNANLSLLGSLVPVWAQLDLSDGVSVTAGLSLLGIDAVANVALSEVALDALSPAEKEEYIDVLKETNKFLESLIGNHISATVSGTLYSGEEKYEETDGVKYTFTAALEYDRGELENGIYIHLNVSLTAVNSEDDSLYLDLYLLDANPVTGSDGKTTGGYTTDGKYDIYLSVSKYAENSVPLQIYAPVDEILTIVSMVGATAHLNELTFENSAELTEAVSAISDLLNGLLIDNCLPKVVQDKFASLGDSLIPQILGVSLEELLDNLFNSIDDTVQEVEESNFTLSADYVSGITATGESLIVVLNSSLIYNAEISEEEYLTVVFDRVLNNGVYFVGGITVENIFFGENQINKLNIGLKLNYDEVVRPNSDNAFSGYLNAYGLDKLINGVINSVTHKVEGTEDEYDLNHYYLLQGSVTANINAIGFINVDATINFKSVSVYIDEETNNVSLNAHIYYDGVAVAGQVAIDGDADVYISMQLGSNQGGGNIIIKRVKYSHYTASGWIETAYSTPQVEVRSMTLKEFSDNLMDNLTFIFNFGSVITDNIDKSSGSDNGVSFDGYDYGEYLNAILAYYVVSETDTGASWTVAINGNLLTSLIGMTMSDIPVRFNADLNEDGTYTVKSLEILNSTMQLLGNVVKLNVYGSFTYCNPNEITEGNYTDSSIDLFNFNVNVNSEIETDFLESEIRAACGSTVKLPLNIIGEDGGQLFMLDGYYVNGGNTYFNFESYEEEDGVLYGLFTVSENVTYTAVWNKVYTVSFLGENGEELYSIICHENEVLSSANLPEVPEVYGYSGEWYGANGATVTGNLSFTVKYSPLTYKVTFISGEGTTVIEREYGSIISVAELETNTHIANYIYDAEDRFDSITVSKDETYYVNTTGKTFYVVYESDVAYEGTLDYVMQFGDDSDYVSAVSSSEYNFLGWFVANGEGYKYTASATALKDFLSQSYMKDGSTVTLTAVWIAGITATVTGSQDGQYDMSGSYTVIYAEGASKTVADNSDITYSAKVEFWLSFGTSEGFNDSLTSKTVTGTDFSFSNQNSFNAIWQSKVSVVAKVTASIVCNGVTLYSFDTVNSNFYRVKG